LKGRVQRVVLLAAPKVGPRSHIVIVSGERMKKKVLIVDDSSTSRLMHRYLITKNADCEVFCASDGSEALRVAADKQPDLIVMDVMMPDIDGLEVCRRLRKDARTQKVPIILLTFKSGEESAVEGRKSGANEYLQKPVEESLLIQALRRYLPS
jgi:CheY-like chemotaxis protein